METTARDRMRRGVRAAVYRACWRRLEGDEPGAQALLACEVPAVLSHEGPSGVDDELVRAWLDEDTADFDRAVLISELITRRGAGVVPSPPRVAAVRTQASASPDERASRTASAASPAIADLLDGMLAQERRVRATS